MKNKKLRDMTDQEVQAEIKENKTISKLFIGMLFLLTVVLSGDVIVRQAVDENLLFAWLMLHVVNVMQAMLVIEVGTEKRIREVAGKWNLTAS